MRLLSVLASFATAVGSAAPVQADPDPDATFLAALNSAGITYQSGPQAIGIARRACELMDQGHPEPDVIKSMTQQNAGFTDDGATTFTQIAENVYCPQHIGGAGIPPPPPQQGTPWPEFPWPGLPSLS